MVPCARYTLVIIADDKAHVKLTQLSLQLPQLLVLLQSAHQTSVP